MNFKFSILVMSVFLLFACKNEPPKKSPTPTVRVKVPKFNQDNAFQLIEEQLAFGHRYPGSEGHKNLTEWIQKKLSERGATVSTQEFKSNFLGKRNVPSMNIIGAFNPQNKDRILLCAHFDSRLIAEKDIERQDEPIPGADDGASGVAVLLEIGRLIQENGIDFGVDLVFFDAEDQGQNQQGWCQGSQYWSKRALSDGYSAKYGILLDMVGAIGARFPKEYHSQRYAKAFHDKVWKLAMGMGYSDVFDDVPAGGIEDDHYYVNQITGIPTIDIINIRPGTGPKTFGDYHHTHKDDIGIISKRTLKASGQVVTAVIYKLSDGSF